MRHWKHFINHPIFSMWFLFCVKGIEIRQALLILSGWNIDYVTLTEKDR